MKKIKNILRNERGLTLIELLAVVVILAIIAAIAIPAIGGLMDNTKKDAHIANAKQMASAARLYLTGDGTKHNGSIKMSELISGNYMEEVEDPDGTGYDKEQSIVTMTEGKVTNVKLVGSKRITEGAPNDLTRESVKNNTTP